MHLHTYNLPTVLLHANSQRHEDKRVLECLQKGLKIADSTMEGGQNVALFLELLDKYIFYLLAGNASVCHLVCWSDGHVGQAPEFFFVLGILSRLSSRLCKRRDRTAFVRGALCNLDTMTGL